MTEWKSFVDNQKKLARSHGEHQTANPKLVCIDIQPYTSTQAPERKDVLNIGGFSDSVFKVVSSFLSSDEGRFVAEVESVEL